MDENGTVSGGVDTQIFVTASVDASGYETCFKVGPPKLTFGCSGCLLVAVALGLGLDAFGVGVCRPWFCLWLCSFSAFLVEKTAWVLRKKMDGSTGSGIMSIRAVAWVGSFSPAQLR